jgi:hypothetical protein
MGLNFCLHKSNRKERRLGLREEIRRVYVCTVTPDHDIFLRVESTSHGKPFSY